MKNIRFFEWFDNDVEDRWFGIIFFTISIPVIVLFFIKNELIILISHIVLSILLPITGLSLLGGKPYQDEKDLFNPAKNYEANPAYMYLISKLLGILLITCFLIFTPPTTIIESIKSIQDPSRIITVQGRLLKRGEFPQNYLIGRDYEVYNIDTKEQIEIMCRYHCKSLRLGEVYEFRITPNTYQLLEVKKLNQNAKN